MPARSEVTTRTASGSSPFQATGSALPQNSPLIPTCTGPTIDINHVFPTHFVQQIQADEFWSEDVATYGDEALKIPCYPQSEVVRYPGGSGAHAYKAWEVGPDDDPLPRKLVTGKPEIDSAIYDGGTAGNKLSIVQSSKKSLNAFPEGMSNSNVNTNARDLPQLQTCMRSIYMPLSLSQSRIMS